MLNARLGLWFAGIVCTLTLLSGRPAAAVPPDVAWLKVNELGQLAAPPSTELRQPAIYRQVLILPVGYEAGQRAVFFADVQTMVRGMGNLPEPVFTRRYRDQLLYAAAWLPGSTIASGRANFGSRAYPHPFRGGIGITMRNADLVGFVDALRRDRILDPIGVIVIYNQDGPVTANAVPPVFLQRPYGIARLTRSDIHDPRPFAGRTRGDYVPAHELAHAALNFLDEYIEPMTAALDVRSLDPLTPLLLADDSTDGWLWALRNFLGRYDLRLSEMLADNGAGHMSSRPRPALVDTPHHATESFTEEGGMMFGRGTFHATGDNLMNGNWPEKRPGNRFGWAHTAAQNAVIEQVFDPSNQPRRPNDRIRTAGPNGPWPVWGEQVRLMLFDADKNHRWHPTQHYEIELKWYEDGQWWTQLQTITPRPAFVDLRETLALRAGLALGRSAMTFGLGMRADTGRPAILNTPTIEQLAEDMLPTMHWPLPYQSVEINLPVPMQRYWWRFRTQNSAFWSGWTSWATFRRAL